MPPLLEGHPQGSMPASPAPPPEVLLAADDEARVGRNDTVFSVLAEQARRRSWFELSITAAGCALNSAVLWWRHPALGWLAAGFAAAAAYGVWGLADRATNAPPVPARPDDARTRLLHGVRVVAAAGGSVAAVAAVLGFVAAMLTNWMH